MLLERYYEESLAQAGYLIGCERTGEAIVIDANVAESYSRTLARHRLRIRYVTETHIHADFLSGARALARAHKATLLLSGHGDGDWRYAEQPGDTVRLLRHGDTITIGMVRLDVRHTPGHTPEHLSFLVTDCATGNRPMGLVSGDFLFVGDVGRPDLLEKAAKVAGTMESSARQLFASLQQLDGLPDYLQVWPGHGAGSACGKALGAVPSSTLGYERLFNPALQHKAEDEFVRWVLTDQPDAPPYFAVMKQRNRDGWSPRPRPDGQTWLDANALRAAIARGDQVVDLRGSRDYGTAHVAATINIPAGNSFVTYAGTVLRYDVPTVIIATAPEQAAWVEAQLALIALEVSGVALRDVLGTLLAERTQSFQTVDAAGLAAMASRNGARVIDVRGTSEWNEGHLPGAQHIYLGDLVQRAQTLDKRDPVVVYCQTGSRSSIAASLLRRAGFADVTNFPGGVRAWLKANLPLDGAHQ